MLGFDEERNLLLLGVDEKRINRKGIEKIAVSLDGRQIYHIYKSLKVLKDDVYKLYFDEFELPLKTVRLTSWFGLFTEENEKEYLRHYVIFIKNKPREMWIFDRNMEEDSVYNRIKIIFDNDFIRGRQIALEHDRVSVKTEDELQVLLNTVQRRGSYFINGELVSEVKDRYTPYEHKDYKAQGWFGRIIEYFEILVSKHHQNISIENIRKLGVRGSLKPLIAVIIIGVGLITLTLPLLLLITTKLLRFLYFEFLFKKSQRNNSGATQSTIHHIIRQIKQRIKVRLSSQNRYLYLLGPFTHYLARFYNIQDKNKLENLLKEYYENDHKEKYNEAIEELHNLNFDDLEKRYEFIEKWFIEPIVHFFLSVMIVQHQRWDDYNKGKVKAEDAKKHPPFRDQDLRRLLEFIKADKDNNDFNAQNDPILRFGWRKYLFTLIGMVPKNIEDPKDGIKAIAKIVEEKILGDINEPNTVRNWLRQEYQKRGLSYPIYPLNTRIWGKILRISGILLGLGLFSLVGVIPFIIALRAGTRTIWHYLFTGFISFISWQLIKDSWNLAKYTDFHLGLWLKGIWWIMTSKLNDDLHKDVVLSKVLKQKRSFFRRYLGWLIGVNALLWFSSLYYGASFWAAIWVVVSLLASLLGLFIWARGVANNGFIRKWIGRALFIVAFVVSLVSMGLTIFGFFSEGYLFSFSWIVGFPILILTSRASIRTWWYLIVEAKAHSKEKHERWDVLHSYEEISKEHIDRIRILGQEAEEEKIEKEYLREVYLEILIEGTLKRHYLIDENEETALRKVVEDRNITQMPQLKDPHAKIEIIKWFNMVLMTKPGEIGGKIKSINLAEQIPWVYKGVGKKTIIPLDLLDIKEATMDDTKEKTKVLKTAFYIIKEQNLVSWERYLRYLLGTLGKLSNDSNSVKALIDKLMNLELSFADTVTVIVSAVYPDEQYPSVKYNKDTEQFEGTPKAVEIAYRIVYEFIMFRADGFLKTQVYAQESALLSYRVFLKHKLEQMAKANNRSILEEAKEFFKGIYGDKENVEDAVKKVRETLKNKLNREPTDEEIAVHLIIHRFVFMITCHEDINPDKPKKGAISLLMNQLSDERNWRLDELASLEEVLKDKDGIYKVLVSKKVSNKPENKAFYNFSQKFADGWPVKTNTWSVTARFIEEYLLRINQTDAIIHNADRDHFFYPSNVFLTPIFVSPRFVEEKDLGWLCTRLEVYVDEFMPPASDHRVAEDNWNTRVIPVEAEVGMHAYYGPGIIRWDVMRVWGSYMDNIEDTGAAIEALKLGWRGSYTPYFRWARPREMVLGAIPTFQNRFGGLVTDTTLQPHFQQLLKSDMLDWTEKLSLFENFDFYFNKPIVPRYNLLIFLFAMFVTFTPFAYLAIPLFFVGLQYIFCQAITAGGPRIFINQPKPWLNKKFAVVITIGSHILLAVSLGLFLGWLLAPALPFSYFTIGLSTLVIFGLITAFKGYFKVANWFAGYALYLRRMWSLAFTFIPIIPLHEEKVRSAFEGTAGIFSSGIKDIYYPQYSFSQLYLLYKPGFKWAVILLTIFMFAPFHPFGIIGQLFFYLFPLAFLFGPFLKNGYTNKEVIAGIWSSLATLVICSIMPSLPIWLGIIPFIVMFGIGTYKAVSKAGKGKKLVTAYNYFVHDRYIRGITQGFLALGYTVVEMATQLFFIPFSFMAAFIDKVYKKDYESKTKEVSTWKKRFDSINAVILLEWLKTTVAKTTRKNGIPQVEKGKPKNEPLTLRSFFEGTNPGITGPKEKGLEKDKEVEINPVNENKDERLWIVAQWHSIISWLVGLSILGLAKVLFVWTILASIGSSLVGISIINVIFAIIYIYSYGHFTEDVEEISFAYYVKWLRLSLVYSFVVPVYWLLVDLPDTIFNKRLDFFLTLRLNLLSHKDISLDNVWEEISKYPRLKQIILDINNNNEGKAKEFVEKQYKAIIAIRERVKNQYILFQIRKLLKKNNNTVKLRQAKEQSNIEPVINPIWDSLTLRNLKKALLDVNDHNPDKAKKALFDKMWEIQKQKSQKQVDQFYKDQLPQIVQNNLPALRQAKQANDHTQLISDQFWQTLPEDFREALLDINDRNPDKAKKALFDKMWEIQKQKSQKQVDQFYKDQLPQIIQAN
ncbi:MAG: hypothetical protein NC904_07420, partial [Candidatus Omnitrophica bacterium]|nr:hypothetical protein [Candidatus Omnitrophota bacterium]